jgi:hypothetical protein
MDRGRPASAATTTHAALIVVARSSSSSGIGVGGRGAADIDIGVTELGDSIEGVAQLFGWDEREIEGEGRGRESGGGRRERKGVISSPGYVNYCTSTSLFIVKNSEY